jgi:two-component system alkaline phosphatase synthesis response regulator PhoP
MEMLRAQRTLVVDDEPPLVELVRGYLAREGFEIVTAGDGPTAVPEKT